MEKSLLIAICIIALLLILVLVKLFLLDSRVAKIQNMDIEEELSRFNKENDSRFSMLGDYLYNMLKQSAEAQDRRLADLNTRFSNMAVENEQKLDAMRNSLDHRMEKMNEDNIQSLEKIRETVDEKLQETLEKRLSESFRLVSERLEQVYMGLGQMQELAAGVGDLKKVLSNVKTRGVLGEVQLSAILEQIMTREQYDENVVTKPGSKDRVEFAVKLPGNGDETVYLPIDAKFPADKYSSLVDAYESGSREEIEQCAKILERSIRDSAKYIHDKYVEPPYTTDFAILFLPFEGLYAEVVRRGMVEKIQRDYRINIAGPTTMAALLNSLQMGFKTLAIEKHSSEVWEVLGAVKTEFGKFETTLKKAQERINQANNEIENLIGTRSNAMNRKLRNVTALPESNAATLLGLETEDIE